jgi:hypothetical protein
VAAAAWLVWRAILNIVDERRSRRRSEPGRDPE